MTLPGPEQWPVEAPVSAQTTDILHRRAGSSPDTTALLDSPSNTEYTYAEFDARVSKLLAGLQNSGRNVDGRVGLMLATGVAFAELYFAIARGGGTLVPLNLQLDDETLAEQAERAGLDFLVCDSASEAGTVSIAPDDVPILSIDEPRSARASTLEWRGVENASRAESTADTERLVLFTSGTTGEPKGVRLTMANLVSSAVGSAHRLGVNPDDRWLDCLPMYHMGGLAPLVRSTLYGTTTVIQPDFDAAETASGIDEYDVTCVSLVPTMLKRMLDGGWHPPDHLRFVLLGGGPATPELVSRCEKRGVSVCPTYGATETASQVATATPETAFEHRGTVGEPLRGTTVRVLDESGTPCNVGESGELAVAGPTVSPGYLDPEQTAAAFGPHGFQTGDVGYRDEAGLLWIVGRVDDQVVTGGENVQPAVVAATIRQLEIVENAVVLGIQDEEWGERMAALVEPSVASPSEAVVRDHCRDELAEYEIPKTVRFVDTLPTTPSGTVDRERARALLQAS